MATGSLFDDAQIRWPGWVRQRALSEPHGDTRHGHRRSSTRAAGIRGNRVGSVAGSRTGPVSEIHAVPDDDVVQAHVDSVVTLMLPVAPPGGTVTVSGATVYVHVAACSVTPKLLPAIVNVAVLDCVVELDAAVIPTLPEPVRVRCHS